MKLFFSILTYMAGVLPGSAQSFLHYLPIDSARQIIETAKKPEKKFYGYYGADRYYMNSGMFDSSELTQKEMYIIAKNLNEDSLLCDVYAVMSNRYLLKQDFNYVWVYVLRH